MNTFSCTFAITCNKLTLLNVSHLGCFPHHNQKHTQTKYILKTVSYHILLKKDFPVIHISKTCSCDNGSVFIYPPQIFKSTGEACSEISCNKSYWVLMIITIST